MKSSIEVLNPNSMGTYELIAFTKLDVIAAHELISPFESFLKQIQFIPEQEIDSLAGKVKKFLLDTYGALENIYGTFGEMGIDFGIDKNGQIWFIEPNAKSAKVSFLKAYDLTTFHKAFRNPVEFAKYLYYKDQKNYRQSKK